MLPLIPLMVLGFTFYPNYEEDYRKALGFTFLVYGYLIGWNESWWDRLRTSLESAAP